MLRKFGETLRVISGSILMIEGVFWLIVAFIIGATFSGILLTESPTEAHPLWGLVFGGQSALCIFLAITIFNMNLSSPKTQGLIAICAILALLEHMGALIYLSSRAVESNLSTDETALIIFWGIPSITVVLYSAFLVMGSFRSGYLPIRPHHGPG
jgi:hypothetical protein